MDQPLRFAGDLDLKMLRTILERLERGGGLFAADIVSYDSINALRAAYEDMPGLPRSSLQRRINLHGVVVTADAMHSQRAHAGHVTTADGHYLLVAKGNQKKLCKQLRLLPWRQIPLQNRTTGAGTAAVRPAASRVCTVRPGPLFPHAVQAMEIKRRRTHRKTGKFETKTVYAITSLPPEQAGRNNSPNSCGTTHQLRPCTTSET